MEKQPDDAKLISKIELIKWLYRKGWKKDDVLVLFDFIDWVITLPEPYDRQFCEKIEVLEENIKMQYVNTFERHCIKKGEIAMLVRQLERKFKEVPDSYRLRIENADVETLLVWGDRVLDVDDLEEIFKANN